MHAIKFRGTKSKELSTISPRPCLFDAFEPLKQEALRLIQETKSLGNLGARPIRMLTSEIALLTKEVTRRSEVLKSNLKQILSTHLTTQEKDLAISSTVAYLHNMNPEKTILGGITEAKITQQIKGEIETESRNAEGHSVSSEERAAIELEPPIIFESIMRIMLDQADDYIIATTQQDREKMLALQRKKVRRGYRVNDQGEGTGSAVNWSYFTGAFHIMDKRDFLSQAEVDNGSKKGGADLFTVIQRVAWENKLISLIKGSDKNGIVIKEQGKSKKKDVRTYVLFRITDDVVVCYSAVLNGNPVDTNFSAKDQRMSFLTGKKAVGNYLEEICDKILIDD